MLVMFWLVWQRGTRRPADARDAWVPVGSVESEGRLMLVMLAPLSQHGKQRSADARDVWSRVAARKAKAG